MTTMRESTRLVLMVTTMRESRHTARGSLTTAMEMTPSLEEAHTRSVALVERTRRDDYSVRREEDIWFCSL
jgi:hypothetical protein